MAWCCQTLCEKVRRVQSSRSPLAARQGAGVFSECLGFWVWIFISPTPKQNLALGLQIGFLHGIPSNLGPCFVSPPPKVPCSLEELRLHHVDIQQIGAKIWDSVISSSQRTFENIEHGRKWIAYDSEQSFADCVGGIALASEIINVKIYINFRTEELSNRKIKKKWELSVGEPKVIWFTSQ